MSGSAGGPGKGNKDDAVKDKFREALERKRGSDADRAASEHLGSSKVHAERAAAKTKRTFRRKSG
jgi:hypothetical protein